MYDGEQEYAAENLSWRRGFANLRKAGSYYVDKTELLYELVSESDNAVTLFTRPRRFGKILTMSMIENFFSVFKKVDDNSLNDICRICVLGNVRRTQKKENKTVSLYHNDAAHALRRDT